MEEKGWPLLYLKDDDVYRLQLSIPGDRYQDVYINFRRDEENFWIATIWSVIASLEDFDFSDPAELLRFNWRNLYGALAIREDQVVLLQNQLTDEANWNEVGRAVHYIGNTADSIEESIYGDRDEN